MAAHCLSFPGATLYLWIPKGHCDCFEVRDGFTMQEQMSTCKLKPCASLYERFIPQRHPKIQTGI